MTNTHEFTLILSGTTPLTTEQELALYQTGCDDATSGFQNGQVTITFTRKVTDFVAAVNSAITTIKNSNIGMEILKINITTI